MKRKNVRTLSEIADAVHSLERANIIDYGDLLIEAKDQVCEHGDWLNWLETEFELSVNTAWRRMTVAKLAAKFPNLRNLKLGKTTFYALADHKDEADLPAIIEELAKHATKTRLAPRDAERVIEIGIGRRHYGSDYPDATLAQLAELIKNSGPWHEKAVAALQEQKPESDERALSITNEIFRQHVHDMHDEAKRRAEAEDEVEQEAESILDGAPPDLPPSITPPELQKFGAETEWEGRESFADAVTALLGLRTKPAARFVGNFSPAELHEVGDFLMTVAAADKAEVA